jgi:hypothetical protein
LPTKAICCRFFTPAQPDSPAASVKDFCSGAFTLAAFTTPSSGGWIMFGKSPS